MQSKTNTNQPTSGKRDDLKKCNPVWGSCNLPSGHKGKHNAQAEWPPASGKQEQWTTGTDGCGTWGIYHGDETKKGWSGKGKLLVDGLSQLQARTVATAHELSITAEREKLPVIEAELKRLGEIETLYLQQLEEIQQLREQLAAAQAAMNEVGQAIEDHADGDAPAVQCLEKIDGILGNLDYTTAILNEYVAKECQSLIDALEEVRKVTDDPRLGTINYMEGSHIYADMNNATKLIDAALAQWKEGKS